MTDDRGGHAETQRAGVFRLLLGLIVGLFVMFFGNLIVAALLVAYLIFLLVIAVIAGIVFDADVGLGVFLTSVGLSTLLLVALGLRNYRRKHPDQFRNDLREAVVAWVLVLVVAGGLGGLLALAFNLIT
ncbi:MAG TPA: hypothetical protein VIL71_03450 [Spirillospora sp.]